MKFEVLSSLPTIEHLTGLLSRSGYLSIFLILSLSSIARVSLAEPIVIHNPQVQNETLSSNLLKRIYVMQKKTWSDGTPIRVFTLPDNAQLHKAFVNKHLHLQPYQLKRLWHRLLFSGTGSIPTEVSTIEEMLEKIETTRGSIGYIDSSMIERISESMLLEFEHE